MTDSLWHTTSLGSLRSILGERRLRPRGGEALFVSLSERPLVHGDIRGKDAVLEFAKDPLSRRLLEVEYTEEWAEAHPEHVSYIAGEGWREQFTYEPAEDEDPDFEDDEERDRQYAEAEFDSFLAKSDESEWITRRLGQVVRFEPQDLRRVIVDADLVGEVAVEFPWARVESFPEGGLVRNPDSMECPHCHAGNRLRRTNCWRCGQALRVGSSSPLAGLTLRNSDEERRKLERAAATGDQTAADKLARFMARQGLAPERRATLVELLTLLGREIGTAMLADPYRFPLNAVVSGVRSVLRAAGTPVASVTGKKIRRAVLAPEVGAENYERSPGPGYVVLNDYADKVGAAKKVFGGDWPAYMARRKGVLRSPIYPWFESGHGTPTLPESLWWEFMSGVRRGLVGKRRNPDADPVVNVALMIDRSNVEGPGTRFALWTQGCGIRCPGCVNPDLFSDRPNKLMTVSQILAKIKAARRRYPEIEGITIMGGEPFEQDAALAELARQVQARGLSVMVFTGHRLEELKARGSPLLPFVDLLVDGPYVKALHTTKIKWIGSSNQRLLFMTDFYRPEDPKFLGENAVEVIVRENDDGVVEVLVSGFPFEGVSQMFARGKQP